jgi:ethanolaminephosphotransferase
MKFCKDAQSIMSGTASNYDVPRLIAGAALATLSFLGSAHVALQQRSLRNVDGAVFLAAIILYGVMMFASSYVEEEQHYWYWLATGWFAYLRARR